MTRSEKFRAILSERLYELPHFEYEFADVVQEARHVLKVYRVGDPAETVRLTSKEQIELALSCLDG